MRARRSRQVLQGALDAGVLSVDPTEQLGGVGEVVGLGERRNR